MATETQNYKLVKPDVDDSYDVADFNTNMDKIDTQLKATDTRIENLLPVISGKIDKVNGKGLSTNDFTNAYLKYLNTDVPQMFNSHESDMLDIKMLGYTIPHSMSLRNSATNNTYIQRVARIDLGTLAWSSAVTLASGRFAFAELPLGIADTSNVFIYEYNYSSQSGDKSFFISKGQIKIYDSGFGSAELNRNKLKGVYLYYELAEYKTINIGGNEVTLPLLNSIVGKNAGAHNGIYRGINLLERYSLAEIYTRIYDGSFDDLFVGDYFTLTINGEIMNCILAGFDLFLNTGDTNTTRHHAVVVTEKAFTQRYQMGASGTTGGFVNSNMWTTVIPEYVASLESVIGSDHLISYRTELSNSVSSGSANGYEWVDCKMSLLSEIQLMGQATFATNIYECAFENSQFPLFALNPSARVTGRGTTARTSYFLKTIATNSNYVAMREDGHLGSLSASSTNGFRPFFLIG